MKTNPNQLRRGFIQEPVVSDAKFLAALSKMNYKAMTIQEVGEALGVSKQTAYRLFKRNNVDVSELATSGEKRREAIAENRRKWLLQNAKKYTRTEAAEIMGVTPRHLSGWLNPYS